MFSNYKGLQNFHFKMSKTYCPNYLSTSNASLDDCKCFWVLSKVKLQSLAFLKSFHCYLLKKSGCLVFKNWWLLIPWFFESFNCFCCCNIEGCSLGRHHRFPCRQRPRLLASKLLLVFDGLFLGVEFVLTLCVP